MINQFPDSNQIVYALREMANYTDDPQEKILYLEKLMDFNVSNRMPFAYRRLMRLYEEYDSTKAMSLARKAISVIPPYDEKRVPSSGYHFLFSYYLKRDTLKAIDLAKELLQSENKDPDLHTRMANKFVEIGKTAQPDTCVILDLEILDSQSSALVAGKVQSVCIQICIAVQCINGVGSGNQ